ncbi:hypothetical protein [Cohnella boryungensis]|uniref:Uncharacterized protein n=1 Tax=Cohnella boryungensis TaxID=768479 RepID=A0ABV8SDC3_9BACL
MEDLISFLANNFHIVLIVIGVIYSIFFRKRPLDGKPPKQMPEYGQGQAPQWEDASPADSYPEHASGGGWDQFPEPTPAPGYAPDSLPASVMTNNVTTGALPSSSRKPPAFVQADSPLQVQAAPRSASSSTSRLRRDELARAVLWSEILGKPRARKPFRR